MNPALHFLPAAILLAAALASCAKEPPKDPLLARAEAGDAVAQLELAEALAQDETRFDEALGWLRRAASGGSKEARAALAAALQDERLAPEDFAESIQILDSLASEGHADSALELARLHAEGIRIPRDADSARAYVRRAAELGNATAKVALAQERWNAERARLDKEERRQLKSQLYELGRQGEPRAYGLLGIILDSEGDIAEADKWHFEAAKVGDPYSMYRAGLAYHRQSRSPSYGPLGFDFLQRAEAAGVSQALAPLGLAYARGRGVEKDERRGLDLLRVAAWRGESQALTQLVDVTLTQKQWSLDETVEAAALFSQFSDLSASERARLQRRAGLSGRALELLGRRRAAQIAEEAARYRAGAAATFQIVDTSGIWARYGEDAALAREALQTFGEAGAEASYRMGLNCLYSGNKYIDPAEAVAWLSDAMGSGHAAAGLELYRVFKSDPAASPVNAEQALSALETSAERGHGEAALALARERQPGGLAPADPGQVVRLALLADAAGLSEGMQLAKETILAHPEHAFDVESSRRALDALADDGDPQHRFERALRQLAETIRDDHRRYRPSALSVTHRIADSFIPNAKDTLVVHSNRGRSEIPYSASPEELPAGALPALETIAALASEDYAPAAEIAAAWRFSGYFLPQDRAAAMEAYEALARDERSADALLIAGYRAVRGFMRERDLMEGARLIRRAFELGSKDARYFFPETTGAVLGSYYDLVHAAYRAAELEDTSSMLKIADYYRHDHTLDKETREAEYARWLTLAARNDDVQALTRIGIAYALGDGVEKNPARGIRYLERCAELGSAEAQYVYGQLLISGGGVEPDLVRGLRQLENAAASGDLRSKSFLEAARRAFPGRALDELEREQIVHIAISSVAHQDHFPVAPHVVADGRLRAVTGVTRERPAFEANGQHRLGGRSQPGVFLAAPAFHPATIDVTVVQVDAPLVFLENGWVYTGRKPAIAFSAKADSDIAGVYCALLVDNVEDGTSYEWKYIGELKAGKERKIRFAMESAFFGPEDVAIAFFAGGAEILSDVRKQPNHFAAGDLTEFTRFRYGYLAENREATLDAALYKPVAAYIGGIAELFAPGDHALIDVSELGFVARIEVAAASPKPEALDALLAAASRIAFAPALRGGEPVAAKARVELAD